MEKSRGSLEWEEPSDLGIIASRTVKTTQNTDKECGINGNKKTLERKTLDYQLEAVLQSNKSPMKFNVIPLARIVEKSFASLYNFQKIVMNYKFYYESS